MNSIEITNILDYMTKERALYFVIGKDELISVRAHTHKPTIIIVNTQNSFSKHPGHWILIFISLRHDKVFVWDSYGMPLSYYKIFLPFPVTFENNVQVQSYNSKVCGEHSIYAALNLLHGLTCQDILKSFSQNCAVNDHKVQNFVRSIRQNYSRQLKSNFARECLTCCEMSTVLKYFSRVNK